MNQVLAVVSGKGGTGKTTVCAGVAICLAEAGRRVLCIDADVGLRNLDISLGLAEEPAVCFTDVMRGTYSLSKAAVHPMYGNLHFLTAPVTEDPEQLEQELFCQMLQRIRSEYDWCLIDAPAGVGAAFRMAVAWADQAMVVTGSDPGALRDGARTAQIMETISSVKPRLVVNRIRRSFFRKTSFTIDDCMDSIGLPLLGIIPEDAAVPLAAAKGMTLRQIPASSKSALTACSKIADRLMGKKAPLMKL